ncbi:type II secretion system GspH family protein [Patescibacteria group bacterium]|nr:type II secretion system GspH family protein [Patescibacteria group bacterium]
MKGLFKSSNGFSLIELLISITIIGVLATIVLNSVSNSRAKAYDSKIKQQLDSFRIAAEMYFTNQSPNSYGPAVPVCTAGIFNNVDPVNGSPGLYIDPANLPDFTQVVCGSTDSEYAVKATLFSGSVKRC